MSRFDVKIGSNPDGSGAHIREPKRGDILSGSIHDMAELFDLKAALQGHTIGRHALDDVAARRRGTHDRG